MIEYIFPPSKNTGESNSKVVGVVEFEDVLIPAGYSVFLERGTETEVGTLFLTVFMSRVTGISASFPEKYTSIDVAKIPEGSSTENNCASGFANPLFNSMLLVNSLFLYTSRIKFPEAVLVLSDNLSILELRIDRISFL